ncbi:MAG: orotidine-5'-phosphate decarboxylase [Chloroflexi bacterium]|nr:orotidine-5'-phosphate decarboxylase [Chloroflexota bacterium]
MLPNERIIVALDFDSRTDALGLVDRLGAAAPCYKVGLQLLTAEGPAIVHALIARQKKVFLDLKLHEIPNSVASAVAVAGALGVSMVTVHASGGAAVMRAAVEAARRFPDLRVLALTVITSLQDQDLAEIGVAGSVRDQVLRLAQLAAAAGCHGVVASPQEAALLRAVLPAHLLIVTPGVQLPGGSHNDQARTATPAQAIRSGSTHIVLGRSIARAADPGAAFAAVYTEVEQALSPQ